MKRSVFVIILTYLACIFFCIPAYFTFTIETREIDDEVCSNQTNHCEIFRIQFNDTIVSNQRWPFNSQIKTRYLFNDSNIEDVFLEYKDIVSRNSINLNDSSNNDLIYHLTTLIKNQKNNKLGDQNNLLTLNRDSYSSINLANSVKNQVEKEKLIKWLKSLIVEKEKGSCDLLLILFDELSEKMDSPPDVFLDYVEFLEFVDRKLEITTIEINRTVDDFLSMINDKNLSHLVTWKVCLFEFN